MAMMSSRRSWTSDLLRLGVVAGLCLLIGVYLILTTVLIARDGTFYIGRAQAIDENPLRIARGHPPGYPFLLWIAHRAAASFAPHDSTMLWVYSAQGVTLLCRVLALVPLYFLGRLLVGARDSFWALLILVVLPYPAEYGSDVLREWPHVLFLSLGFWLLYWGLYRKRWWVLGIVGLGAGLGFLIRPECGQLVLYGLLGLAVTWFSTSGPDRWKLLGAGLLLIAGFAVPAVPYIHATGSIVPNQLRPSVFNVPPIISVVGPKAAAYDPLEFEIGAGELLELPVKATDPDAPSLTLAVVSVPMGSRPVYQFRSIDTGARFWTISEHEKESLLATHLQFVWDYEGIAYYAYAGPDDSPGLKPVHRFWSPARSRHLFTTSRSERDAIRNESPEDSWEYEGIAFYAFGESEHPEDAVAVYRFWDEEKGHFWEIETPGRKLSAAAGSDGAPDTIAWYVHTAGEFPAGAVLEGRIFRWRPARQGEYQLNIIVSDGEFQSCQLVKIRVLEARAGVRAQGMRASPQRPSSAAPHGRLRKLLTGVDEVFDAVAEDLMVFFFLPWLLGIYCRLRYRAGQRERVLMIALVVVSIGLMLTRHVWLAPGSCRRYSLGMIALTILYVPAGLALMARWLSRLWSPRRRQEASGAERESPWFYILALVGIGICMPKLLTSARADKIGYRAAAVWLRENTQADDVIAVPDSRISFYADRRGLLYREHPDSRKVDYVVRIADKNQTQAPDDWRQEYSVSVHRKASKTLTIYKTTRRK